MLFPISITAFLSNVTVEFDPTEKKKFCSNYLPKQYITSVFNKQMLSLAVLIFALSFTAKQWTQPFLQSSLINRDSNAVTAGGVSPADRVARWYIFIPKIPIWVKFGGT
jgi:hypothetical protein